MAEQQMFMDRLSGRQRAEMSVSSGFQAVNSQEVAHAVSGAANYMEEQHRQCQEYGSASIWRADTSSGINRLQLKFS